MSKFNKTLLFLNFAFIAAIIAAGAVLAWTGPGANPPIGSGLLYYANSNVGIGTQSPAQKLDVSGTIQATGFKMSTGAANGNVLTSDASGLGSWQTPAPGAGGDLLSPLLNSEVSVTGATTATIGKMHVCSGTTADYTVTLPVCSGNAGKLLGFRMSGALTKLVTLDGNGGETIDGEPTRIMWAKETAILYCDGTTWTKIAGKSIPMYAEIIQNGNQNFAANTPTLLNLSTFDSASVTSMADTANKRIILPRTSRWLIDFCVGFSNQNATAGNRMVRLYINGSGWADFESYATGANAVEISSTKHYPLGAGTTIQLYGLYYSGSFTTTVVWPAWTTNLEVLEAPSW